MTANPLLELSKITKEFPGVIANDAVSFSIAPGEIHALLGENGAGKSTLVKMIYGIMQPDSGTMVLNGADYVPHKPFDARACGIGMVFQHFSLFEALTVAENVSLGMDNPPKAKELNKEIIEISNAYGLLLDPLRRVGSLSVGERQRIEIVRCLLQHPKLLIMDEPTSVLTPQEANVLFTTLRRLASEGCSILYISHKLSEIKSLCDKATVLRGGKIVGHCDPRIETTQSLAEMMIGSSFSKSQMQDSTQGDVRLKLDNLSLKSPDTFGVDLKDISLSIHGGEILGIGGVAGNGQLELMEALIGERYPQLNNMILLDGEAFAHSSPTQRRGKGMCCVPEERLGHGAVPSMTLWENTFLSARTRKSMEKNGFLNNTLARNFADSVVELFKVKTRGTDHAASTLSGGNLQKFIVGREVLQSPTILVISQPTWGVDAGAASDIHRALQKLAHEGAAILVISQDLDELMSITNRFAVICEGRVSAPQPTGTQTIEDIGMLMGGFHTSGNTETSHV